ncbi:hypothetical protein ACTFIZ_000293 [Dictyostelium cf. discoideum]
MIIKELSNLIKRNLLSPHHRWRLSNNNNNNNNNNKVRKSRISIPFIKELSNKTHKELSTFKQPTSTIPSLLHYELYRHQQQLLQQQQITKLHKHASFKIRERLWI